MGKEDTKEALADETNILVDTIIKQGVDCVVGGFPCQDISVGNANASGVAGLRSGLVWEAINTFRLVGAKYLLLENVAALLARGMGEVLGVLASSGDSVEWDCVPASAVGAPHHRSRIYILAYNGSDRRERHLPGQIHRQPEFSWLQDVRGFEDMPERPDLYPSKLCRGNVRTAQRLHGIGNGNPPCVIREIMKILTTVTRQRDE